MSENIISDPHTGCSGFLCVDCAVDTYINEQFYMLLDELWFQFASDVDTMLCLNCFEKRLGRALLATDFAQVPLNEQQALVCQELAVRLNHTS